MRRLRRPSSWRATLIPERIPLFARASTALLLLAALAACGTLFKKDEAVQGGVNDRAIGMSAGEFFDQFGVWRQRTELLDGTTEFSWTSPTASRTALSRATSSERCGRPTLILAPRKPSAFAASVWSTSSCGARCSQPPSVV